MKPITIIETEYDGCGYLYCNGNIEKFGYNEGELDDIVPALQVLIKLGTIPANMVKVYTLEEAVTTLGKMAEKESNE